MAERHVPATLLVGTDEEALVQAAADIELWESQGHTFLTILDEDYPGRLRGIHEAPPVLFGDGEFRRDDPAVSVVGSREASDRGLSIARSVATSLAQEGVTVLAGLALGIDTAAHLAALGCRAIGPCPGSAPAGPDAALGPPYGDGVEALLFGMSCFRVRSGSFRRLDGVVARRSATKAASRRTDLRRGLLRYDRAHRDRPGGLRLGGGRRVDDGRSEWSAIRHAGRLAAKAPVSWSGAPVDRGGRGGSRAPQEHARAHQRGGDDQPG